MPNVCQVLTEADASLQQILGINCTVTGNRCKCESELVAGQRWFPAAEMNHTANATPGHWFVMDKSGKCVASLENDPHTPVEEACPPGFYCAGGREPPRSCNRGDHCPWRTSDKDRRCKFGYFCPVPGGPMMTCPNGAVCPPGSESPQACEAGTYCKDGLAGTCPPGHYCPLGTVEPRRCHWLSICNEGSATEDVSPSALFFLAVCAGLGAVGARNYSDIVQQGLWVCLVFLGIVVLLWLVDTMIAGFCTLVFVIIAANWALLQVGQVRGEGPCPSEVARLLVGASIIVALCALWIVNPPWCILVAGLVFCSCLGWLMSHQNLAMVLVGRVLFGLSLCGLFYGYSIVDPGFVALLGTCIVLCFGGLVVSWVWEQYRQGEPFNSRWFQPSSSNLEADTPRSASRSHSTALEAPPTQPEAGSAREVAATGLAQGSQAGVSFHLEKVNFYLPDGKHLLQDISLSIAPGSRVAVMGPSGSGKSTLLAALSGRASYGRIEGRLLVGGRPLEDLRILRSVTGFVPQDDVLHGELTVAENIRFQAALRLPDHTSSGELAARVAEVADNLNLKGILKERVGTPELRGVSGGQRKRVSIAMELVAQPLLLFADEPTSGLDSTTSHEVVRCLNTAAAQLGTTVVAVIHQPRFETLQLFDDLVLLGAGGYLVYAGATGSVVEHFKTYLQVDFPATTNPADVLLDSIQEPHQSPQECASVWKRKMEDATVPALVVEQAPCNHWKRQRVPLFRAVLIYMDRSMLQAIRAHSSLLVNQGLCIVTTWVLCFIVQYKQIDQFMMQSVFATLFVMLLQGVAAQRIFGADLLVTMREARVGMPMIAYLIAKDLAALFEVTLSSAVFTATYGSFSGAQLSLRTLFAGTWAFVYCVFGLNYFFSIVLSPGAAQMSAVVSSFIAMCVAGFYQPALPEMAAMIDGRGWMVPALSPIRWLWSYLLTAEVHFLTDISRMGAGGKLAGKGYDLKYLDECGSTLGLEGPAFTLYQAWTTGRGWVCSTAPLLLLGLLFRFIAGLSLILHINAQTSGWSRFIGQSDRGAWKLAGALFKLLACCFMALFFFAEVWIFGILKLKVDLGGSVLHVETSGSSIVMA